MIQDESVVMLHEEEECQKLLLYAKFIWTSTKCANLAGCPSVRDDGRTYIRTQIMEFLHGELSEGFEHERASMQTK